MMNISMLDIGFWASVAISLWPSYLIFRDIADVSQFWLKNDRATVMSTWYRRHIYLLASTLGLVAMVFIHLETGAGVSWVAILTAVIWFIFIAGGYFNPGWMMRTQQSTARFTSIEEAKNFIHRDQEVLVIEHKGEARAHTDYELWRPHVVGTEDGLGGENIVMSYCAMTNLGMALKPEIDGKTLKLKVMTQLENNLVMWDQNSGEPIQQIWRTKECDGKSGPAMAEYPLYKMPFDKFAKAYPTGQVFHRRRILMKENPLFALYDKFWEAIFYMAIHRQKQEAAPVFPTLVHEDDSLPPKEHVWGINIGDDAVCYSVPFVQSEGNLINTQIGGRDLVVHWDADYESLGVWYNDFGRNVSEIDFFGKSDLGEHARVESVKAGLFYAMWFNFFPATDVNRKGPRPVANNSLRTRNNGAPSVGGLCSTDVVSPVTAYR